MLLAQISDTHIMIDGAQAAARADNLRRCVAAINALDPLPDAAIHTGDLTQHGRAEEVDRAWAILQGLRCPFYLVPGNRDGRAALLAAFADNGHPEPDGPFVQYAVERHPLRLIAVDTLSEASNKGDFCAARARQLHALLEADGEKPAVLFMHHPPYSIPIIPEPFQFTTHAAVSRLDDVLARQRHAVRAFCGHAHRLTIDVIGGVPISTMTSVAVDLRKGDYPEAPNGEPIFQTHHFDARSKVTTVSHAAPA